MHRVQIGNWVVYLDDKGFEQLDSALKEEVGKDWKDNTDEDAEGLPPLYKK